MHVYIYDTYVSEKKFAASIARVETRITDLGLSGKIIRLGLISSIDQAILSELKKGAKTIVIVGGIKLLSQATNALAKINASESIGQNTPLAFIPIGKNEAETGNFLGLGLEEEACNVLSQRRMKTVGLGLANNNYFLFSANIPTDHSILQVDESYTIEINQPGLINVVNLPFRIESSKDKEETELNPLELVITTKKGQRLSLGKQKRDSSLFPFKTLRLENTKTKLNLDYSSEVSLPATIKPASEKINLIVGKDRDF